MKRLLILLLLTPFLVACSSEGSSFKIDGHLLNLNRGEFYVYSPDGIIQGLDTIFVTAGRFAYKGECNRSGTLVIVFPNFSEQPVFVRPGCNIKISGDASHLKELKVAGTNDNKLMTGFREQCKEASIDEAKRNARQFVDDHPESIASIYIINKYFIRTLSPAYATALQLMETVLSAQPDNGLLSQDVTKIKRRADTSEGKPLPEFVVTDIDGDTITNDSFSHSSGIIYLWASYEYEGCNIQRILKDKCFEGMTLLGICVDTSLKDCMRMIYRDKIETPVVCDSMAFESGLVQQLGLTSIPDNIVIENGKVIARNLTSRQIKERYLSGRSIQSAGNKNNIAARER